VIADLAEEIGLPAGVLNVVTGAGHVIGEALAGHPAVDLVSLTGSNGAGQRIMELAAPAAKRVTLELGGKSATVVLDDADLDAILPEAVVQSFRNTGQNCSALSRLIVPRRWLADVERRAEDIAAGVIVGDPFDAATQMGPLVSEDQRSKVRGLIQAGLEEGARLIAGGLEPPDGLERGFFLRPTVFSDIGPQMRIAREEIFGPVLSILAYDAGDDEAIELANASDYGLSGAVWSADAGRAERVARRIRTGRVVVNGGPFNPRAPFGGVRASGFGRELGRFGIEEFLEVKTLQR
jgi:acyl-CoA reductase-like NAD-dependent aldehyde dehydrogenase